VGSYDTYVHTARIVSVVVVYADAVTVAVAMMESVPSASGEGDGRDGQDNNEQDFRDSSHDFVLPVRSAYPPVRHACGRMGPCGYTFD